MITIDFTYQVITPESAEHGDIAEHGFMTPGMWTYPMDAAGKCDYERNVWSLGDLSGLISFAQSLGICSDGDSFYSVDPDFNYTDGSETTYGMHLSGCTASTESRIHQLLTL